MKEQNKTSFRIISDYDSIGSQEVFSPLLKVLMAYALKLIGDSTLRLSKNKADLAYDLAMEAVTNESLNSDVYLSIVGKTEPFVISTLPFDINKRIPFSLKAGSGAASTYKVSVGNIINFDDLEHVYLYDGVTGVYHDIMDGSFEISLPQGVYENRFEITFRNGTLGVDNPTKNNITIYQNNSLQNLVVANPDLLEVKEISLFDITGKRILEKKRLNTEAEYKLPTSGIAEAVYIVNVKTNKGNFSQKVLISKSTK